MLAGTYCGDRTWISAPTREFLHVEDAAEGILLAAKRYNESDPVNPSTWLPTPFGRGLGASPGSSFETCRRCRRINIPLKRICDKDLVETIARSKIPFSGLTGFSGTLRVVWDTSKPGGDCAANPCARRRTAAASRWAWGNGGGRKTRPVFWLRWLAGKGSKSPLPMAV